MKSTERVPNFRTEFDCKKRKDSMFVCNKCGAPATVHLTDIVNKVKHETHLCEVCAQQQNLFPQGGGQQLNLPALLELLMGHPPGESLDMPAPTLDSGSLVCPDCGLKYAQFRADGRLGCPADYDNFREPLEPILERVHRNLRHVGKVPRAVQARHARQERAELERLLQDAIATEHYEEAARLRDRIREKDAAG